jgi:hypothetical protein
MDNAKENNDIISIQDFAGKFVINENYRPIAEALKNKFQELEVVQVNSIIFIDNTETKKKINNSIVYAQVGKIPEKYKDIIYQFTGKYFSFMIEVFKENTVEMSREQMIALIYHELRHIQLVRKKNSAEITIVSHEVNDWLNMIEKLGVNWNNPKSDIPNLLDNNINWDSITGPMNLFQDNPPLRLIK